MLNLHKVTKSFGNKKILDNITATVHTGDFIILVGANGSGKSTLFNIIAGTLYPDCGTISITDNNKTIDITHHDDIFRTHYISQLFQNPKVNTVEHMTVAENISLALMKGNRVGLQQGQKALDPALLDHISKEYNVDLSSLMHKKMGALSGGQRQLIAFIMATLIRPKLLLLDEPTAALDPQAATTLLSCAYRFIKEHHTTAILVTHDPQLALTLGNKLWILQDGTMHQFNEQEKSGLTSDDLIGHIDYTQIQSYGNSLF